MSGLTLFGALLATSLAADDVVAQEQEAVPSSADLNVAGDDYPVLVFGAKFGQGEAMTTSSGGEKYERNRWSYSGFAYVDYYVFENLALEAGVGVISKGHRYARDLENRPFEPFENRHYNVRYLEVPVGLKLNLWNVRVSALCALDVGVKGTVKGLNDQRKMEVNEIEWSIKKSKGHTHRFNIAPKVALGYAFAFDGGYLVPSIGWSMDLLSDSIEDDRDRYFRNMNITFSVALELGI